MRIAVDVRSLMEGRHSGVEEYTVQIIRGLLRIAPQHQWRLFYNSARRVVLPHLGDATEVRATRYPNKIFNLLQLLSGQPRWDTLTDADCFFVPHVRLLPISPGVKLVTTVHDLSFEHFPELFSWQRRLWHHLVQPRRLLARSDHIIAVSGATAMDLTQLYGIAPDKISVVHSGVRTSAQPLFSSASWRKERGQLGKYNLPEKFVLYLGTLEPRKNVVSIIRAFDAIAQRVPHDLVIAGSRGWLMREVDVAYRQARWRGRIHFVGFVPEADKQSLYAAADLFVYPSLYEGFGFPPLEALLAGTSVITSNNSSLPEIVGEWATLINPYDVGELALVMRELLVTPQRLSEEVRGAIARQYSWDRAAQATLAIIEGVAAH
ncbi:MAG TPA: glycosyltransferase family 1 protein [Candidatus Andersenbacteria bacterium]|nr:glycosyltransferase family 1 protein [Candidatus Andersenbacteria bacterium]